MYEYLKKLELHFIFLLVISNHSISDSFIYNSYNNHGVVGLINMPSARFYDEGTFGINLYKGTPDQKITITSSPYDWMEASFFYTNIENKRYCESEVKAFCRQDYKDKGFNFKLRVKEEGRFPAIAIGINDIAGTGLYSSEYIVSSYGINNLDMHIGLGWGALNTNSSDIKNPLTYLSNNFKKRPITASSRGGQFEPSRYFSGEKASPFYGISYALNKNILIKVEKDVTKIEDSLIKYSVPKSTYNFSLEFNFNENINIALSKERDDFYSLRFTYKKDASNSNKPYRYVKKTRNANDNDYNYFIKSLNANGIGVNKLVEKADSIGLEITQFSHPNLDLIEEIIYKAKAESNIKKDLKKEYRIVDLKAYSELDSNYYDDAKLIFERKRKRGFSTDTKVNIRPFIASREEFFKLAIMVENKTEFIIKDNFVFNTDIKYSIKDNFQDLNIPPENTFPAQVRSDVKEYLKNFNRPFIARAQFDYHVTPINNNHLMFSAGILEEMFNGYGFEYLYFDNKKNYAVGVELFNVRKRDYDLRFGTLNYKNLTGHVNFYYKNYKFIPFDGKISYGEYLAGDEGLTFEVSRSFKNGAKFGVFATFTDVSAEDFGEGSFDKGIFFNIPVFKNFVNYSWSPLTKDPGSKLNRRHTLNDLLIKFKAHEKK